jgi:hypothetical protein
MTSRTRSWAKPFRRVRPEPERGLGERGYRPRYGAIRGASHRSVVAEDGRKRYPHAKELLITADGGGSNGNRCRLWKVALQALAVRLGMPIHVCHFPPGTSKWNKIEHRMFCHITQNWRGRPLVSHEVIINLIANTTTQAGLKIRAELDRGDYPIGIKISDAELSALNLKLQSFMATGTTRSFHHKRKSDQLIFT